MLSGKKILVGISGSIAAYKIPLLVRELVKSGAEVKVVMTPASEDFVSRLTLSTLSTQPVLNELFDEQSWANHVALGRWADLMVIAPLSCNTLSKMASGRCDNLLMAVYLSATCPVMVAPAMDEDMWLHPTTKSNLATLHKNGNLVLDVGYGSLASGLTGAGRMAEPQEIQDAIENFFRKGDQLKGKKALVSAGPTHESLDPVRFIGNHSTGKMGYAIAEELAARGADVVLVSGPVSVQAKHKNIRKIDVTTAAEMYRECTREATSCHIAVMAAAVADYRPASVAGQKIKKSESSFQLILEKTEDILASLGKEKPAGQVLAGFALETNNEEAYAQKKLKEKNADLIVLNSLNDVGSGFGHDTNQVTLFFRNGNREALPLKPKTALAADIVDAISKLL